MASNSSIEWTGATWTAIRAIVKTDAGEIAKAKNYNSLIHIATRMAGHVGPHCERVSPGCEHCYSETNNSRCLPFNGTGLPFDRRTRDLVDIFVDENILTQPLRWKTPKKVFVCSQTDLFGEWVPDEVIDRVFAVMGKCPQHTFQVLTKRADRMKEYASSICLDWKNVWLGVSVENQEQADKRIPLLLQTPSAVRWVSAEPLLGPVDFSRGFRIREGLKQDALYGTEGLRWIVVGGESGPGARPFNIEWARQIVSQCKAGNVPVFVKQLGANPFLHVEQQSGDVAIPGGRMKFSSLTYESSISLNDRKGGDFSEFPPELQVREFPG
jgi:protein gp37